MDHDAAVLHDALVALAERLQTGRPYYEVLPGGRARKLRPREAASAALREALDTHECTR
jgi:hypothetical protein